MIPPTPTPLPPGVAPIDIPYAVGLWGSSGNMIQAWNWIGTTALVIQAVFLILIVVAGLAVLKRFSADFIKKDSEE